MSKIKITAACVACLLIAGAAAAAVKDSPSTQAYMAAMTKMHDNMMIDYTGDADVDFVRGMIPHHQGRHRHGQARAQIRQGPGAA